jgi:carbon monoxide dehydrogenase subunit G
MKLQNRFTVPVPVEEAWRVLLDVERIAPCMPGATLTSIDGDAFEGTVKVKVGPINLTYGGKARFVSKDDQAHVAVIDGSGKETRGTGTAKALITCRLLDKGATTAVEVDTDLNVTGKPAQFGRGVLADVSSKLVDQFAACLSDEITAGTPAPDEPVPSSDASPQDGQPDDPSPQAVTAAPVPVDAPPAAAPGTAAPAADVATPEAAPGAARAADGGMAVGTPAAQAPPVSGPSPMDLGGATGTSPSSTPEPAGPSSAPEPAAAAPAAAAPAPAAPAAAPSTPSSGAGGPRPSGATPPSTGPRTPAPRPSAEPIDLLGTAGAPVLKRLAPVLGVLAVLVVVLRRLRR